MLRFGCGRVGGSTTQRVAKKGGDAHIPEICGISFVLLKLKRSNVATEGCAFYFLDDRKNVERC